MVWEVELVDKYPVLSKIFTLEPNSTNEVYLSLYKYMRRNYPELFTPIGASPKFVNQFGKDCIEYYESLIGLPFKGEYKIIIRPTLNNKTYGFSKKRDMKPFEIELERVRQYLQIINLKRDVKGSNVKMLGYKASNFLVVIDPRMPLIDAVYVIAHEMAHVYSLSQVYQMALNLQTVHTMSTSEFLAVALSYKYLVDNDFYYHFGMNSNIIHYEYFVYSRDFLSDEKNMLDYARQIIENGVMYEVESIERYHFSNVSKLIKLHRLLYTMTVEKGSFIRKLPLEEVLSNDYMLVYYILNPEEFQKRFTNVYTLLSKAEGRVKAYHPKYGTHSLTEILRKVKEDVTSYLIEYESSENTIREKHPIEYYAYHSTIGKRKLLLNSHFTT